MKDELSPEAKATLNAARAAEPRPTHEDKARVRALIAAAIVAPAIAPMPAHAAGSAVGIKVAGVLLAVGIGAGVYLAARPDPAPAPAPVAPNVVPVAPKVVPVVVPVAERPIEAAPPAVEAPPPKRAIKRAAAPLATQLAEETRLIRAAKAALRQGDAATALAKLGEHEALFPHGQLREERIAVGAMALCRAGRAAEGRAARDRLAVDSAYRAAVEKECE